MTQHTEQIKDSRIYLEYIIFSGLFLLRYIQCLVCVTWSNNNNPMWDFAGDDEGGSEVATWRRPPPPEGRHTVSVYKTRFSMKYKKSLTGRIWVCKFLFGERDYLFELSLASNSRTVRVNLHSKTSSSNGKIQAENGGTPWWAKTKSGCNVIRRNRTVPSLLGLQVARDRLIFPWYSLFFLTHPPTPFSVWYG